MCSVNDTCNSRYFTLQFKLIRNFLLPMNIWPWNQPDRMLQSALQTIWTKWYTVNVEIPNNTDISLKLELLGKYHKHIIICFSIMTGFFPLNLFSFEMIGPISWTISWKNGQLNRKCLWKSTSEKLLNYYFEKVFNGGHMLPHNRPCHHIKHEYIVNVVVVYIIFI